MSDTYIKEEHEMSDSTDLEKLRSRLDSQQKWIAGHEGRINAIWMGQEKFNDRLEVRMDNHDTRLNSIEKKVMLMAGGSAAGGAILGQLIQGMFKGTGL